MKKFCNLFLILLLSSLGLTQVSAALPTHIKIGTDSSYPPFEYMDKNGRIAGFDIDIATEICHRNHIQCEFVPTSLDGLIPALLSKKIDMIASALAITEKRQKQIAFSQKVFDAKPSLLVPKESKLQPTAESLKGKRVGVEQGSTQEYYANKMWRPQGVQVVSYPNQLQVYADLIAGRIDASFQDTVTADLGFLNQPQGKEFKFAGMPVHDEKFFGKGTGFGFRQQDKELQDAVNHTLAEMLADGTYQKISQHYFDFNIYGE